MLPATKCEVCGAKARVCTAIGGYNYYRCGDCAHLFVFPRPSREELDVFYMMGQYYDKAEAEHDRLLRQASQRLRRLDDLVAQFGLAKRLLDVGCAIGYFIKQANEEGWQTFGIDRSVELARRAKEYTGTEIIIGTFEDGELADKPYPVVVAWEVIEHTPDPRAFFAVLTKNVEAGGLLALSTPLANGLPAKLLGARFPMLSPPEHLSLFTRRSINLLASEFDFEEVGYRSFSNLGPVSLANGFAKLLFGKNIAEASGIGRFLCGLAGFVLAWVPIMVDLTGWGTEMEIIFRRKVR